MSTLITMSWMIIKNIITWYFCNQENICLHINFLTALYPTCCFICQHVSASTNDTDDLKWQQSPLSRTASPVPFLDIVGSGKHRETCSWVPLHCGCPTTKNTVENHGRTLKQELQTASRARLQEKTHILKKKKTLFKCILEIETETHTQTPSGKIHDCVFFIRSGPLLPVDPPVRGDNQWGHAFICTGNSNVYCMRRKFLKNKFDILAEFDSSYTESVIDRSTICCRDIIFYMSVV